MPQTYTQKYTIVCFFSNDPKVDFPASDWPLHATMLDTFKTPWSLAILSQALADLAASTEPFESIAIQSALLGEARDVPVKLLKLRGGLITLHQELLKLAEAGSFIFNTPEFVGDGFLPHATDQADGEVQIGHKYLLEDISLVDMIPDGDHTQRRIIGTWAFSS
jgi:hypothetical protein